GARPTPRPPAQARRRPARAPGGRGDGGRGPAGARAGRARPVRLDPRRARTRAPPSQRLRQRGAGAWRHAAGPRRRGGRPAGDLRRPM
ncbi:MAG: hypothetical protein AVDCRST_MAG13-3585, partial [uncultured Solirubrobacteraceae bacterium]